MIEFLGMAYMLGKEVYGYIKDGKEIFDAGKGVLDAAKGVKEHFEVKEIEPKLVDMAWLQKSGFDKVSADAGYTLAWSRPDKVASREIDGYELMYEIDKAARTKRKLVLYDGLVLLGKKAGT
jgi:hypothetical protein